MTPDWGEHYDFVQLCLRNHPSHLNNAHMLRTVILLGYIRRGVNVLLALGICWGRALL